MNEKKTLIIGSHVSMSKKNNYLLGALEDTINNNANAMMIYTGAPQNTIRVNPDLFFISEFHQKLKDNNLDINNVIIHAPYIINLANTIKPDIYNLAVNFLQKEINTAEKIGVKTIVLHPGSAVSGDRTAGLNQIISGLNTILNSSVGPKIALETMAGKGNELGKNFNELKYIIDNIKYKERIGVCWDTCHMHDAGYNLLSNESLTEIITEFDKLIGINKILCLHINDSKNIKGAAKDRHENIGYGHIGFLPLIDIIYCPLFNNIPKILETPYVNNNKIAPYQAEIEMIRNKIFNNPFKNIH